MDAGLVVNLGLGILWLLGCLIFVTFLMEFRDDFMAHPNYQEDAQKKERKQIPKAMPARGIGR